MLDYLLILLYSLCEGIRDAAVFAYGASHYMKEIQPYNIHRYFLPVRCVVYFIALPGGGCVIESAGLLLSFAFAYPFFHQIGYHETRRLLETKYSKRFWHHSKTSTATINPTFLERSLMLILSVLLFCVANRHIIC